MSINFIMIHRRAKILVVEDASDVRLIIQATLSDSELTMASSVNEAASLISKSHYDLYILDVGLPDGDGFGLCTKIRQNKSTQSSPILFLSGRSSELDKLTAFGQGADDYITKPFSTLELKARVQAKLRGLTSLEPATAYHSPPLRLDIEKRKLFVQRGDLEEVIKLTKIEFNLLKCLVARPEVIKSRATLLDEAWGDSISVTERSVDVHIYNLRKKLGEFADMIGADHGNGYFLAPRKSATKAS